MAYIENKDEISVQSLKAPTLTKLVLLLHEVIPTSKYLSLFLFIWSQAQIFFIISKSITFTLENQSEQSSKIIQQIFQALFLEEILKDSKSPYAYLVILSMMGLYLIFSLLAICCLFVAVYKNYTLINILQKIMAISIRVHPFIGAASFHIVSIKGLIFSNEEAQNPFRPREPIQGVFILSLAVLSLNIIWSFVITFLFSVRIKNKDILSVKTDLLDIIELSYKILLPLLWNFIPTFPAWSELILVINMAFCFLKVWILFQFLPYYNLSMLRFANFTNCLPMSFICAVLFRKIAQYCSFDPGSSSLLFCWIFFFTVVFCFSKNRMQQLFLKILLCPTETCNPFHLLNYMKIYKFFSRYSASGLSATKVNQNYFHYISAINQSEVNHLLPSKKNNQWNIETQKIIDKYFQEKNLELLERYDKKNPKLIMIKLGLARSYIKSGNLILANYILDLCLKSSINFKTSVYLTKMMMLSKLKLQSQKDLSNPLISEQSMASVNIFIKLQEHYESIKQAIVLQTELQERFWKDFQLESPNFLTLQKMALKIYSQSSFSRKILFESTSFVKAGFSEPFITLGLYFCFVQNDFVVGQKFFSEYWNIESRNKQKYLTENCFNKAYVTLNSFCLIVSALPDQLGKIISCYGKIPSEIGIQKELLVGKSISTLMPVLYSKWHDSALRSSKNNLILESCHNTGEVLVLSEDNTIISCKIYLSLKYLIEQGLCFSVILKPVRHNKRLVIIGENGLISNFSREFAIDMGIRYEEGKVYNIFNLCPDLRKLVPDFHTSPYKYVKEALGVIKSLKETNQDTSKLPKTLNLLKQRSDGHQNEHVSKSKEKLPTLLSAQIKETSLTFNSPSLQEQNPISHARIESIAYHAEIRKVIIQNAQIIELRMSKLIDDGHLHSLRPKKRNNLNPHRSTIFQRPTVKTKANRALELNTLNSENRARTTEENLLTTSPPRGDLSISISSLPSLPEPIKEVNVETSQFSKVENIDECLMATRGQIRDNQLLNTKIKELSVRRNSENFDKDENLIVGLFPEYKQFEKNLKREIFGSKFLDESLSSRWLEAHNIVNKVIESRKQRRLTKNYYLVLGTTLFYFFGFLVWLNIYVSSTSKKVENLSQVLKETYFRNYWTNIANQETRIWIAKRKGYFISPIEPTIESNRVSYQKLNQFNQNLRISTSYVDDSIQDIFNNKQVRSYERDTYFNLDFISVDNTFELINKVVTKGLKNVFKENPDVLTEGSISQETRFVLDNSSNDLLISSNQIAAIVREKLFHELTKSRETMRLLLLITLAVLVVFIGFSVYFIIDNNSKANMFMEIMFSLSPVEVQKVEKFLGKLRKLIEKDSEGLELIRILHLAQKIQGSNIFEQAKSKRAALRKASMKKFYLRNYLTFSGLFINLGLIVGFIFFYYLRAIGRTNIIEKQQISIDTALRYINTITITSVEIQSIILENNTANVRNIPVFDALTQDIEAIKSVHSFQRILMDMEGGFPDNQQEIFFNISCEKAYSPLYSVSREFVMKSCKTKDKGLGRIGLANMLSELVSDLTQLFSDYRASIGDEKTPKTFYLRFFGDTIASINLSVTLLMLSFTSLTKGFQDLVLELEANRVLLGWIAGLVTLLLGGMTWIFVGKKLLEREFERNKILSLIPKKLILSNYRLKMYVSGFASSIGYNLQDLI